MNARQLFVGFVALAAIVTGAWLSYQLLVPPPVLRTATVLPAAAELPEFTLTDQYGNTLSRDDFAGHWNLVFFGFTHCPDICPLTLQVLTAARQTLLDAEQEPLPRIVLVSVDPERDTPDIIGQYVDYFGDDIVGITGDLDELQKLTASLGIFFQKSMLDGDNYSVDHSSAVLVIDPQGRFHALFSAPHEVDNFVNDFPILASRR